MVEFVKKVNYVWEQRKFIDIATRGSSVCTSASDIPSVEYEDVVAEEGRLNKDIRSKEAVKSGITFDGSQVLYGKLRPYLHNWLNPDFKGVAVGDWWVLKPINVDKNFLYRLIQTQQFDNIANQSSGSKMPRADWNLISNSEFMVPLSKKEQSKIGRYFDNLDHLITLHQRKIYIFIKNLPIDWEQRKLGEIYGSIGNAFVGTATPYYVEQGHFYLESNNVKDGQINHNSEIFINDEFYEKQKDKWLHTGDMVMVQSGHVGHAAVIPEELDNTAAHALIMFRNPKEKIEPYFLNYEYQTNKAKKKIENITTGNTIKHILASDMQEFVVDVPKYEEQKVIADYFSNLDHLITLHHRKCVVLRKMKVNDWEQRKFSELVMIERGGSPRPIDKYITKAENGLNWVKIGDAPEQSNYITKTSEKIIPEGLSKTREVHPGDLILSNSMSFGRPYIMAIDGCIHDGWLAIRDTEKRFDLKFLCTLLGTDSMLNQYKAMAAGSTVNNLNKELVGSTIVSFPKMDEQTKIGEYFTNLDHLITLHHRECVILRKMKVNDWEQRKLGEIAPLRGGYAFQSNNFLEEGIPIVKISNILSTGEVAGEFSFYEELDNDTNFILPDKAAVLAMSGATTGKVSILSNPSNIKFYQNQRVGYFKKTDGINYPFISTLVRSQVFNNQLNSILVTGAQPNVSSKDIDDFDVLIPTSYKEQKKIGAYFSNLDHLITLHHHEEFCTENVLIYIEINKTIQIKEDIMAELESVIEQKLIDQLVYGDSQWTYRADLKTEEDLWNNFRYILEQNNKDRLNGEPLSDTEFEQVKNQLQFSSFYKAGEWLVGENGKVMVHVQRDTERLHLVVMNHEHIAGGSSVYEVINQYRALADEESQTKAQDRRFDVTLMINGLPMIHIELKNKQHSYMDGFWQIKKYIGEGKFTGIFSAVQMFVISNGVDTKYFSAASDTELNPKFISGWLDNENNPVPDYLDFAKSVLRIPEAHEMIARYTVLDEEAKRLILLRPYQIHAIEAIREASKTGKSGFVWHTTGSGKTLTSYKATRNLLMDIPSIDKAIFLIDRKDLDTQTSMAFQTYANNDLVDVDQTDNVFDLKKKLKSDDRQMIVTTIQKLQRLITKKLAEGTPEYNKIKNLKIAFVVDECHRAVTPGTKRELERFFANSLWYGFTGTPRFAENPYPQLGDLPRTTEELYGERLHRYTIQNAIHDNAVLGFQVEHNGPKNMDDETDSSMYENETHMLRVLDVILNKSYHKLGFQNGKGKTYEGLLTTSSIQLAQKYYELLKRVKNGETELQIDEKVKQILPDFPKFAITYSVTENEEGSHLNQEKMKESINDYNEMFGTKLDISQIQSYNANLNKRLARKEPKFQSRSEQLDLVIVVDRLLTGFDAPCMSTLFVDRQPMGPHDLIQAFSRTNRIFDKNKTYGQIVTFQAPKLFKECVDNAVKLYSAGSTEIALLAEWEEIEPAFRKALKALRVSAETPAEIPAMSEKEKVLFVKAFQNFDKLFAQLKSFTQYEDSMLTEYGISEDEYDDYAGHYLNVKEELKAGAEDTQSEMEEQPIDVDYELMAYSNTKIDYEYIINLIQNIVTPDEDVEMTPEERQKQLEEVKQYIDDLRKENPKVADIMSTLVSEIEQDEVKYKGQSILNIVENMKHECIEKVVMDFSITWYVSKDDVMYAATHYRNGEIPNESAIKSTADFTSFKEAQERAIPKFKYYNMMIEELRKTLEEEIKPLLNN